MPVITPLLPLKDGCFSQSAAFTSPLCHPKIFNGLKFQIVFVLWICCPVSVDLLYQVTVDWTVNASRSTCFGFRAHHCCTPLSFFISFFYFCLFFLSDRRWLALSVFLSLSLRVCCHYRQSAVTAVSAVRQAVSEGCFGKVVLIHGRMECTFSLCTNLFCNNEADKVSE